MSVCWPLRTLPILNSYLLPTEPTSKLHSNLKITVHCLEHLRQTASCRGDISVIPYKWVYLNDSVDLGFIGPTQADAEAMHRCINWDRLHAWAKERRVDLWNYRELLVNDWVE